MADALRRIPAWAWLTAIVVGSFAFRAALGRGIVAPFVMVDEIIWSELARGIADAGEPLLRGEPDPGYSVVYPLLISPAYALFANLPDAYEAVKVMNAAWMSLAAVPAYLIARRVVSEGLALLAAVLAVALPSLAYTGTVMTENVFYPLFLVVVLTLLLVLERPTLWLVLALVALLGLAFATRVQAAALVPAVLLAPLVHALLSGERIGAAVARFRTLYFVTGGLALVALALPLLAGGSPNDLLGAYSPVGEASYDFGRAVRFLWWHIAELSLYVLVLPLAATVVLLARARSLDARLQAFLAATVSLTVCLLPVVAVFASRFSDRIEERNLFYVAPLLCIGLLAWVERGAPRPAIVAPVAGVACGLLVLGIPFDRFLTTSAITDTLMLLPFWSLQDRIGEDWVAPAALALAAVLVSAFLFVPRRFAVALPLVVLGLWVLAIRPIWWGTHGFERFAEGSLFQGIRVPERDWVDRALPDGASAAFLWTGRTDRLTVNQNEFFSRGVGPVYYLTRRTPGDLPETRVRVDPATGAVTLPDGSPVRDGYLLADSSFEPDGVRLAADRGWGVRLWKVRRPLVSAVRIDGLYPNDTWSGEKVTYVRRRCRPGKVYVSVSSDPSLFSGSQTIVARKQGRIVGRLRLAPTERGVLTVPLEPSAATGRCRVAFTVTPTAVPSQVQADSTDDRVLGAHFNRFHYIPDP